ncbi:MAG TPA: hypothetical protein VF786_01340 [Terriglobales bacterium]
MRTSTRIVLTILLLIACAAVLLAAGSLTVYQSKQTPPIKLGTSGGNVSDHTTMYCCSGTLGALVAKNGQQYILSNNHVLARSDQAATGEDISQPGMVDTNCSTANSNIVADFTQAAKLGTNVDAAIAQVRAGMVATNGEILTVGVPANTMATPAVNMGVAKAGRTTGFTCSSIAATNTSVTVQYETQCGGGSTFNVSYTGQVLINSRSFSAGGDSGSLIVNSATAQPVALLFAGSNTTTIANPIGEVAKDLGVTFVGGGTHTVPCTTKKPRGKVAAASYSRAIEAKEKHAQRLMLDDAVMAVGVSSDDVNETQAVVLVVVEHGRQLREAIPAQLDGVKTKVLISDKIRAFGWNEATGQACRVRQ